MPVFARLQMNLFEKTCAAVVRRYRGPEWMRTSCPLLMKFRGCAAGGWTTKRTAGGGWNSPPSPLSHLFGSTKKESPSWLRLWVDPLVGLFLLIVLSRYYFFLRRLPLAARTCSPSVYGVIFFFRFSVFFCFSSKWGCVSLDPAFYLVSTLRLDCVCLSV